MCAEVEQKWWKTHLCFNSYSCILYRTLITHILCCFPAVCLCRRMDWRVLPICRWCLSDKTKPLFEWSHMHYNKSALISSPVHLQMPPRLHRWDNFALLSVPRPFHQSVCLSVGSISQNMDWFLQTLVGRLVMEQRMTDVWGKSVVELVMLDSNIPLAEICVLFWHLVFCKHVYAIYAQRYLKIWGRRATQVVKAVFLVIYSITTVILQSHARHLTQRALMLRVIHEL